MENHYSVMVIGGLCKMDLTPLLRISLHGCLMAKQSNKNLLPLVADGLNREVRGCSVSTVGHLLHEGGLSGQGSTPAPISWCSCWPLPAPFVQGEMISMSRKCFKSTKSLHLHYKKIMGNNIKKTPN